METAVGKSPPRFQIITSLLHSSEKCGLRWS